MSKKDVQSILDEFGAKSEEELRSVIDNEWNIAKCSCCGKNIDLLSCSYIDSDPVCRGGCYGQS